MPTPKSKDPLIGKTLGDYKILRELGGGMVFGTHESTKMGKADTP